MHDREYGIEHRDARCQRTLREPEALAVLAVAMDVKHEAGPVEGWLVIRVPLSRGHILRAASLGILDKVS